MSWGHARSGTLFSSRITALRAELPPSVESMLADGRDGIGTQAKSLPKRGISKDVLKSVGKGAAVVALVPFVLLAGLLSRLFPKFDAPSYSPPPSPPPSIRTQPRRLESFWSWLKKKIWGDKQNLNPPPKTSPPVNTGGGLFAAAMKGMGEFLTWTADLMDARKREVNRLMKLLDENPDEGLKFALPMGGEAGRGQAAPSASLLSRMIDFRLGGRGGGPTDVWDLPPQTQMELVRRYRDLAAREIQLGRYRRAAYIFAELLGDLNSAAHALVTGRFYREAAVLYRDKLKRPLDAANCLEKGGLLHEAIPLFRQLGQFETVGDLYQRLGDSERAAIAYRDAIAVLLEQSDFLEAARILEVKLGAEDEAVTILEQGWPHSKQARRCLESTFEMRARFGRHEEVIQKINELRKSELPPQSCVEAVEVLTNTALKSPHAPSRAVAADTVRVMASMALAGGIANRQVLTSAISRLAPEDRLLARDCQRATQRTGNLRTKQGALTAEAPSVKRLPLHPRLVRTFRLPLGVKWNAAYATDDNFYVTGWLDDQEVFVARGAWNDPHATVTSVTSDRLTNMPSRLLICRDPSERNLIVASPGGRVFTRKVLSATDTNRDPEVCLTPSWLPSCVSAMAVSPMGTFYTFQLLEMSFKSYAPQRNPTILEGLQAPLLNRTFDPSEVFPMAAHDDVCYLGVHEFLFEARSGKALRRETLLGPCQGAGGFTPTCGEANGRLI